MIVLDARNVNYALPQGVRYVHKVGRLEPSRAGDVLRIPHPVITVYERPEEMVMLHPWRDANPFFAMAENLWMIAGRDDLASLTKYISNFGQFSDDGETVPGAYGKRWRDWNPYEIVGGSVHGNVWPDQLDRAVEQLRTNPRDRRVVIQMWDPAVDIERAANGGKDVPCNLSVLPYEVDGKLNITVTCRSNDIILGAYGANAAHFSFLLCYLAARVGLEVGQYSQVSNNFHAYVNNSGDPESCWPTEWNQVLDPYTASEVETFPIFKDFDGFDGGPNESVNNKGDKLRERYIQEDLRLFFDEGPEVANRAARWPFIRQIAAPMALAHRHWKTGKGEDRFTGALEILAQMPERNDWRRACEEWIQRRYQKWSTNNG